MQGARTTRTSLPSTCGKFGEQLLRAGHGAGQAVADPHRHRRRRRLAFLHHVEMGVEGRDLVDLGERQLHLLRQRGEMRGGEMAVAVLDQVQMLDQQVAPARAVAEQRLDLGKRRRIDLPPLRRARRPAAAGLMLVWCGHCHNASPRTAVHSLPPCGGGLGRGVNRMHGFCCLPPSRPAQASLRRSTSPARGEVVEFVARIRIISDTFIFAFDPNPAGRARRPPPAGGGMGGYG